VTVKLTETVQSAQIEKPIRVTFSNKEIIEFTPKQYSELMALLMNNLCRDCKTNK
jgi:hypothetical protein